MSLKGILNLDRQDAISSWDLKSLIDQEVPELETSVRDSHHIDIRELTAQEYKLLMLKELLMSDDISVSDELTQAASIQFAEILLDRNVSEEFTIERASPMPVSGFSENDALAIYLHTNEGRLRFLLLTHQVDQLPHQRELPFQFRIDRAFEDIQGLTHWIIIDSEHNFEPFQVGNRSLHNGVREVVLDGLGVEILGGRRDSYADSIEVIDHLSTEAGYQLRGSMGDPGVWDNPNRFYFSRGGNSNHEALQILDNEMCRYLGMNVSALKNLHELAGPIECFYSICDDHT